LTHELEMVEAPETGRVVMTGRGLVVPYVKQGDFWTHFLEIDNSGQSIEIVRAFESDPDRDQPARVVSPVFQEVHRHDPHGAVGLLLTGNWFQHHFSAAVSLALDPGDQHAAVLDVDVADRCRATVEMLAATYVVRLDGGALVDAKPDRIVWQVDGSIEGRLELIAGPNVSLTLAEAGRTATRVQILAAIEPGAFTHRLRYQWRWASR
jgi:hypothetical protein